MGSDEHDERRGRGEQVFKAHPTRFQAPLAAQQCCRQVTLPGQLTTHHQEQAPETLTYFPRADVQAPYSPATLPFAGVPSGVPPRARDCASQSGRWQAPVVPGGCQTEGMVAIQCRAGDMVPRCVRER